VLWGPSRHLGSLKAANWVSFDFNVSYFSCWGYSLINTLKLKKIISKSNNFNAGAMAYDTRSFAAIQSGRLYRGRFQIIFSVVIYSLWNIVYYRILQIWISKECKSCIWCDWTQDGSPEACATGVCCAPALAVMFMLSITTIVFTNSDLIFSYIYLHV